MQSGIKTFLFGIIFIIILWIWLIRPVNHVTKTMDYIVNDGDSFNGILIDLKRENLIRSYTAAKILQVMKGAVLKKGTYQLSPSMSTNMIINLLAKGQLPVYNITFPEGFIATQIKERLEKQGFHRAAQDFLTAIQDPQLISKYHIHASNLEGYLFPSTYNLPKNISAQDLVEMMLKAFFVALHKIDSNINEASLQEQVILASIIEKEAVIDKERPIIASVFLNRLNHHMKLESCATVIYILKMKGRNKKHLYFKDLKIDSPYNTYQNYGLPLGPISNPGTASLEAAFHPASTSYLFFVYKGNHEHIFSNDYQEHLVNYKKYIKYQYMDKSEN